MNSVGQAKLLPVFYDFEASSIGGLPIEIGWVFADPKSRGIHSEGHLIKPPPLGRPSDQAASALELGTGMGSGRRKAASNIACRVDREGTPAL
jgi:hypothetical protein